MENNRLTGFLRLWAVLLLLTAPAVRLAAQDDMEEHPRDFNALRFSLDNRHRYLGDTLRHAKTFVSLGGGFRQLGMSADDEGSTSLSVLNLHIGQQLSPLHTLRLGVGGGVGYYRQPTAQNDGPRRQLTMLHADADYLFSLSSYMLGYRPERALDVSTLLGVGVSSASGGSKAVDFHGGLQLKFFAGPHAAITVEPYVMLANKTLSPTAKTRSWHKYAVDYGLNLSYVYYFDNMLTAPALTGTFKKLFKPGRRWLRGDSADVAQRRPLFLQYAVGWEGISSFNERSWSQTSGASYSLAFGGWLSSAIGLRTGIGMSNMRWNEDAQRVHYAGYATVSLDAMLNPFGFGRRYNWDAPVGMHLLGGVETGRLNVDAADVRSTSWTTGYRMGVQTWARMGRDTRFFVEQIYRIINYREGGDQYSRDDALSLKLGVEMLLGGHRAVETVDSVRWQPRGFFIGGGVGWNTTFRRWRAADGHDPFFMNGLLTGGYHFNAYHGVALSGEYLTNHFTVGKGEEGFDHWMLSADWMLNVSNLLHGYQPNRRWTVSVLMGPTVALGTDKARVGGNGALQLDYRINKHLALFYQHRLYLMGKSFYPSAQLYSQAGTVVSSMNAGVLYLFDDLVGPVCYVANGFANGVATAATGVAHGVATAATGVAHGASYVANGVARGASFVGKHVAHGVSNLFTQYRHPVFVEYGNGVTSQKLLDGTDGRRWGSSMQVSLGWWMLPAFGLRGSLTSQHAGAVAFTQHDEALTGQQSQVALAADVLVNPLGMVRNYNWDSPFGFHLIGGIQTGGYVIDAGRSRMADKKLKTIGLRLGGQLWMRLQNDMRLFVEPLYTQTRYDELTSVDRSSDMSVRMGLSLLLGGHGQQGDSLWVDGADRRGFFVTAGGGTHFAYDKYRADDGGVNGNAMVAAGYRFNGLHAVRGQFELVSHADGSRADGSHHRLKVLSASYQLSLSKLLTGRDSRWHAGLFAGPSVTTDKHIGAHAGVTVDYDIDRQWGLFYQHTLYVLSKSRDSHAAALPPTQLPSQLTGINSFSVGVTRRF